MGCRVSRVTLEMGEARELVVNFQDKQRNLGRPAAKQWLAQAFNVTQRRFGGLEAVDRVKGYMRQIEREELCL